MKNRNDFEMNYGIWNENKINQFNPINMITKIIEIERKMKTCFQNTNIFPMKNSKHDKHFNDVYDNSCFMTP